MTREARKRLKTYPVAVRGRELADEVVFAYDGSGQITAIGPPRGPFCWSGPHPAAGCRIACALVTAPRDATEVIPMTVVSAHAENYGALARW